MIRKMMIKNQVGTSKHFRWRGGEVSRVEGLSDAVFAFAVTLLVVSLQVPKSFDELMNTIQGFPAFGICFASLIFIWYHHYIYFRRYGIEDTFTTVLNAFLLFIVLFYVFPLKFLFTLLVSSFTGLQGGSFSISILPNQTSILMLFYSAGFFTIFFIFLLFYSHAFKKREILKLNEMEIILTKEGISTHIAYMTIAAISILITLFGGSGNSFWAGIIYVLIAPVRTIQGVSFRKKINNALNEPEYNTNN